MILEHSILELLCVRKFCSFRHYVWILVWGDEEDWCVEANKNGAGRMVIYVNSRLSDSHFCGFMANYKR